MKNKLGILALAASAITATTAHAHTGTELGGGFLHPEAGIDHLMALIATVPTGVLVAGAAVLAIAAIGAVRMARRIGQN